MPRKRLGLVDVFFRGARQTGQRSPDLRLVVFGRVHRTANRDDDQEHPQADRAIVRNLQKETAIPAVASLGLDYCGVTGLLSRKSRGLSTKPTQSTGIAGQSSVRGMWWTCSTYQTTTSCPSTDSSLR